MSLEVNLKTFSDQNGQKKKKKEMKKKIENIQSTYENKFNPTQ